MMMMMMIIITIIIMYEYHVMDVVEFSQVTWYLCILNFCMVKK